MMTNNLMTTNSSENSELMKHVATYLDTKLSNLNAKQKDEFIAMCQISRLNPFKREIHASVYGDQMTIVVGYEVYLKRAASSKLLDGYNVEFDKSTPTDPKAVITIFRKDWTHPFKHSVSYKECVQTKKDGTPNRFWKDKPKMMLTKTAIAQGMRLCFPEFMDAGEEMGLDMEVVSKDAPVKEALLTYEEEMGLE